MPTPIGFYPFPHAQSYFAGLIRVRDGAEIFTTLKYVDGNEAAGYVLTSDVDGNATWQAASGGSGWELTGNSGTTYGTNFIGTTDDINLMFKVNSQISGGIEGDNGQNTSLGYLTMNARTSATSNVGIGYRALRRLTEGTTNVVIGADAGAFFTTAVGNTAIGQGSMLLGTGDNNTGVGQNSLNGCVTGTGNVCLGYSAGYYETGSNKLFIDNAERANEADARVKALVYGVFDADIANQKFNINGTLTVNDGTQVQNCVFTESDGNGGGSWKLPAFPFVVTSSAFGTTSTVATRLHKVITGSTGATTVNIGTMGVGDIVIVSDLDRISSTSNITIDSGSGNTIISTTGAAQTYVINTDGLSVTIQKVTATKFKVI